MNIKTHSSAKKNTHLAASVSRNPSKLKRWRITIGRNRRDTIVRIASFQINSKHLKPSCATDRDSKITARTIGAQSSTAHATKDNPVCMTIGIVQCNGRTNSIRDRRRSGAQCTCRCLWTTCQADNRDGNNQASNGGDYYFFHGITIPQQLSTALV